MGISISGLTSSVSNAGTTISNVLDGFSGPLNLGQIAFRDFEIPTKIDFGGKQSNTTHKLPGGRRVIDVMGPDPSDYKWEGIMLGSDAVARMKALAAMRDLGQPVPIVFGKIRDTVLITSIEFSYERVNMIRYRIECTPAPTPDDADDFAGQDRGWLGDIADGIQSVTDTIDDVTQQVQDFLAPIATVAQAAGSVLNPILGACGVSCPMFGALQTGLSSVNDVGVLAAANSTVNNMSALNSGLTSAQSTVAKTASSAGYSIDAVTANAATSGTITTTPIAAGQQAVYSAPAPTAITPLVWTLDDLLVACSASGILAATLAVNASVTGARRDLVTAGQIPAATFPTLAQVTNELYGLAPIVTSPADALTFEAAVIAAYAQQSAVPL